MVRKKIKIYQVFFVIFFVAVVFAGLGAKNVLADTLSPNNATCGSAAIVGTNQVRITWNPAPSTLPVYYSGSSAGTFPLLFSVLFTSSGTCSSGCMAGSSYIVSVTPGTAVSWHVEACYGNGTYSVCTNSPAPTPFYLGMTLSMNISNKPSGSFVYNVSSPVPIPTPTPTCTDGIRNGTETGIDCGGSCPACVATALPVCTGSVPSNASMYAGDNVGLAVNTPYTFSASNTSVKCQYSCNSGFTWNGSACVATALPVCTGSVPSNASMYAGDNVGLAVNTPYTFSASNTSVKCQYSCNSGFTWNGSACVATALPVCTGSVPSNASMYAGDNVGLAVNTPYTFSASNTSVKCQYSCNSGFTWNGSACVGANNNSGWQEVMP